MSTVNSERRDKKRYLIIGYGNTLRSDDGAGYRVAETIDQWNLHSVQAMAVHQLTPELAASIAEAETVIFVDAVVVSSDASPEVTVECLESDDNPAFTGHVINPRSLLALSELLYQSSSQAYQILIPAFVMDLGETLSPSTQQYCQIALTKIKEFIYPSATPSER